MESKLTFEKVMESFEMMRDRWLAKADEVVQEYMGCDPRIFHMAARELELIAHDALNWFIQAEEGYYPKESLPIIASVIKQLTDKKYELETSTKKKPFQVSDCTAIPIPDDWSTTAN